MGYGRDKACLSLPWGTHNRGDKACLVSTILGDIICSFVNRMQRIDSKWVLLSGLNYKLTENARRKDHQ